MGGADRLYQRPRGPQILKGTADSYRRLRNMRFLLGALSISAPRPVAPADMPELERWVLHRLAELDKIVREGYESYDFQGVFQAVFTFTVDLSAFYFDIRKDALYCDGDTDRRRAAHGVGYSVSPSTTWLAPLVFTMEEIWLERFPAGSSIPTDIPETPGAWCDPAWPRNDLHQSAPGGDRRVEIERTEKVIGASLEAAPTVYVTANTAAILRTVPFDLCITSAITLSEGRPEGAFKMSGSDDIAVVFARAGPCQRCWKILGDVGQYRHAGVCQRCDAAR